MFGSAVVSVGGWKGGGGEEGGQTHHNDTSVPVLGSRSPPREKEDSKKTAEQAIDKCTSTACAVSGKGSWVRRSLGQHPREGKRQHHDKMKHVWI